MTRYNKYILYLALLSAACAAAWAGLGERVCNQATPRWPTYAAIAFFFLYELATIWVVEKKGRVFTPRRFVNIFMGLKAARIVLSLLFVAAYVLAGGAEAKGFALVFAALYFIYLLFDTLYLMTRTNK
jgi:hypothetical protein